MEPNQLSIHEQLSSAKLEMNAFKPDVFSHYPVQPKTPAEWFTEKFPTQTKIYGCPFLELREKT